MRRLRLLFVAGALVTFGALAIVWSLRSTPKPPPISPAPPSPGGVTPEASLPARTPESPEPGGTAAAAAVSPPAAAPSLADAELIALEEKALRRIDIVAVLEREGIDSRELQRRPDADDLLRHLAADELLTLLFMRQLFAERVYPREYPRDAAVRECRSLAEDIVARLSAEDRLKYLTAELARPAAPPAEPAYAPTP